MFGIHLHKSSAVIIFQQEGRAILIHNQSLLFVVVDALADFVAIMVGDIGAPLGIIFVGKVVAVVFLIIGFVEQGLFEFIMFAPSPLQIIAVAGWKKGLIYEQIQIH